MLAIITFSAQNGTFLHVKKCWQIMSTSKTPQQTVEPKMEGKSAAYDPKEVEAKWTKHWFDRECFDLDIEPDKPKFSIALPPPNITGNLHMGHALNGTLQDVLIRLKRMQGYCVLWQAGTDHAGISTQMVVERKLKKEGKNRRDLGRDKFLEKVWEWRKENGDAIMYQYKRLGVSFAWDRLAFTMDEGYVKAIYKCFVTLFKEGLIYRGTRVTNWCPRCLTSLSDLEVEHEDIKGKLYCIKYPLADGKGSITVATTRPESLFGDVAVAVHPEDSRYKEFVGKNVKLPITGRELPVIADSYVERDFGTGALKITPAHDPNDWEVGQRHKLDMPVVIDLEGKLLKHDYVPPDLQGVERFAAREKTVEKLTELELLEEIKDYDQGIGHCERCHTVIEPMLTDQWYLSMKELAEPAIKAVEEERVQFVPERYASTFIDWMSNIRDWNISRQLWWGHRVPVWTCKDCGNVDAFEEPPTECNNCQSKNFVQDEDVLDTWFSSALWPFATLGWPEQTTELKVFYPTTVLSTAREIINLWVSRMIFMSLRFLKTIPFKHVLIHPVIQTADGKRMSKSKGNAIDPLDMIEKYGADANRFWFASIGVKGDQDVRFREDRLDEYKKFANKLFNAGKFVLYNLEGYTPKAISLEHLTLADRWILHKYNSMLERISEAFMHYDFDDVARDLHEFIWDHFCDWYVEIAKIQIAHETTDGADIGQTRHVLCAVFEGVLRALHPIMPYITEELWSKMPKNAMFAQLDSLTFAPYPRSDERMLSDTAEKDMSLLIRVIRAIRNIRQTYNVPAGAEVEVLIKCLDEGELKCLTGGKDYIQRLARVSSIAVAKELTPPGRAARENVASATIYLPLEKVIDTQKAREKLNQRKQSIERDLAKKSELLNNADFRAKAPPEKVETIQKELEDFEKQLDSVKNQLEVLDA